MGETIDNGMSPRVPKMPNFDKIKVPPSNAPNLPDTTSLPKPIDITPDAVPVPSERPTHRVPGLPDYMLPKR